MAKRKYKIAQSGGQLKPSNQPNYDWIQDNPYQPTPQVPVTDPLARMELDPNQSPKQPELRATYQPKKDKDPFFGYDINPYVKIFNLAARLTTGIANKVTDAKNTQEEYRQYVQSLQPRNWESTTENGLNQNPVYYKTGGSTISKDEAYSILNRGEIKGHPLSRQQKILFEMIAKTGKMPPPNSINEKGGWIQGAIKHPGRCAHPGSPECPEGSPQYNLMKTFQKHHGFHKYKVGGNVNVLDTKIINGQKMYLIEYFE